MNNQEYKNFKVSFNDQGIARISLDVPDRPLNVLNPSVMSELKQIVEKLEQNSTVKVVLIESGKASGFLAGADVNEIVAIESPEQAVHLLEEGQALFQQIESLKMTTVAVIHGPCLGGGLELCLACDYRIARQDESTKIGLPEISLGLIPGWGGTQRLPKLVGLTNALDLILKGKSVDARKAQQLGLIHQAIAPDSWGDGVDQFISKVMERSVVSSARSRVDRVRR